MLGIEINGTLLDLAPGTAAQVERQSPFFGMDSLADEYSLPLTLLYTPNNAKALGLPNHFYTRREKTKIPGVKLNDGFNFSYMGELVIQAAALNVNDITKSTITAYFLTGVSSFFTSIKGKKLKELGLGGIRTFAWTNNNPTSPAKGFWQHVHETLAGTMPYSFAPIRNEKWAGNSEEGTPDWMNRLTSAGTLDPANNYNTLAPQVSLKYVLECVFSEQGWQLDSTAMDGTHWEKLFMPSFYGVTWQKIIQIQQEPYFSYTPLPTIKMDLRNHVPPEYPIANLIIDLRSRYNWGFAFDANARVCRLFPMKDLALGKRKDWTRYMAANWDFDFSEDVKVFAWQNEQDGADGMAGSPDFEKVQYGTPVFSYTELMGPAESNFNQVVFCWKENQYWQCRYNEEEQKYEWAHFADGVHGHEPKDFNETFSTGISTMPVYRTLWRTNGGNFYGLFPMCEQEGNWEGKQGEFVPWTMRLLFHRGLVWEAGAAGFKGLVKYPYLTSVASTITQDEPDLPWSNVYKHEYNGIDLGIVSYWFRESLEYLSKGETGTGMLSLPRTELMEFRWDDIILMRNIPFLVEQMTDVIPYNGQVKAKVKRIG